MQHRDRRLDAQQPIDGIVPTNAHSDQCRPACFGAARDAFGRSACLDHQWRVVCMPCPTELSLNGLRHVRREGLEDGQRLDWDVTADGEQVGESRGGIGAWSAERREEDAVRERQLAGGHGFG